MQIQPSSNNKTSFGMAWKVAPWTELKLSEANKRVFEELLDRNKLNLDQVTQGVETVLFPSVNTNQLAIASRLEGKSLEESLSFLVKAIKDYALGSETKYIKEIELQGIDDVKFIAAVKESVKGAIERFGGSRQKS